jgi:predicted TIM-barrel fold metal-dependent hydrolase
VDRGDPVGMNLALQTELGKREDLFFFPWVHIEPDGSNEEGMLEYLRKNLGAIHGMKFHASISQMSITDLRLSGVLEFADRHSLPLLYHCGRHPISSAAPIRTLAPRYPRASFIVAHLGGNAFDIVVDTMKMFDRQVPENVYFDTSTARHPRLLRKAVDTYGEDRILFGTDLPFTEMEMNWACLEFAGLAKNERILGGNLRRILTRSS